MKRKICVYVSGTSTLLPSSHPPSSLPRVPLLDMKPPPSLRVGFAPPNLGAQTGDAERRALGGTPPPSRAPPPFTCKRGPLGYAPTTHRSPGPHPASPPLPCASPLCHLGATRWGCSNSAARTPLLLRPVVGASTAASPFASYGTTRERGRFGGPDGGRGRMEGSTAPVA